MRDFGGRIICGLTPQQSEKVLAYADFHHEVLDGYEAIYRFRDGSGPLAVAWPAWEPLVPPPGIGPDIVRWQWEDISAHAKRLRSGAFGVVNEFDHAVGGIYASPDPTACYLFRLDQTAHRLIRYAWWNTRRVDFTEWAAKVRAHLYTVPLEPLA